MVAQRDHLAQELIAGLRQDLVRTLDDLRRVAAPLVKADGASLQDVKLGGLPVADLDRLRSRHRYVRPWWARLAPGLAARSIFNMIQEQIGPIIREVVESHDRQL
jgi:hypothetical protein